MLRVHSAFRLGMVVGAGCILTGLAFADEEPSVLEQIQKDEAEAAEEAQRYSEQGPQTTAANATHVQIGTIALADGRRPCQVNTFCMDGAGRLLVAVGGQQRQIRVTDGEREVEQVSTGNEIRVYSQDGQLLESWPLPFPPQALNVGPDLSVYVAGAGQIAKLDSEGRIVKQGATPQLGDVEAYKVQLRAELEEQTRAQSQAIAQQVTRAKEIVEKLQAKPEEERTAIDKLRLRNAERQLTLLEANTDRLAGPSIDLDSYLEYKMKVPGLAVSDQDVFVAVSAIKGYGYEVWRMDHEFGNPVQLVSGLRGCCGQMDIQCQNGDLYVAENSRHRVCRYNRDGAMLLEWGHADRTGADGFEGCCNPMNLRFGANHEVLTAESGCGAIKRYNVDGEFLGLLGHANLLGGCKHVAVAATADATRVFMLDVPRTQICILAPRPAGEDAAGAEATEPPAVETSTTGGSAAAVKKTPRVRVLGTRSAKD